MHSTCVLCLAFLLGASTAYASPLDPADRDPGTPACDDFYQHANGGWLARHPVPAGRPSHGRFDELVARNLQQRRELLDGMEHGADPVDSMLATFWRSGLDEATIEARGAEPLTPYFTRIDRLRRPRDVAGAIAELHAAGLPVAFAFVAGPDPGGPRNTVAFATQGGLGLPDPDFYRRDDAETRAMLGRYRAHVERMLALSGVPAAELATQSGWVVGIEMRLAAASLDLAGLREPHHDYKLQPLAELDRRYPNLRLRDFTRAQQLRSLDQLSLAHESFFHNLNAMLRTVPVEQWQAYLRHHVTDAMAPHLSEPLRTAHHEFHGRLLAGDPAPPPRWQQVLMTIDATVGDAVGRRYVERHVPEARREHASGVVLAVRDALAAAVGEASWLATGSREAAARKLADLEIEIATPASVHGYEGLQLDAGRYAENVLAAARWHRQQEFGRIGTDLPPRWPQPTQVPAIRYQMELNRLLVSAGLLQPPVLGEPLDAAADFGALGALVGQQLTHAVDARGGTMDGQGRFHGWWQPEDLEGFDQRVAPLVSQYGGFDAFDGIRVDGLRTRDANVADLSGVELAWRAFSAGHDASGPGLDGLAPAQRFFHAYARMWQRNYRPAELRMRLASDPTSPARFRVNGPLSHNKAFADAFACEPGQGMVRPAADRVVLWQ